MNNKEIEASTLEVLNSNPALNSAWSQPPAVIHIPFMGTRRSFFLLISVVLSSLAAETDLLVDHCLSICRLVIGTGLLVEENGLEVAAYHCENGRMLRIARLSVLEAAFPQIHTATAAEVIGCNFEGVNFQLPGRPPQ